MMHKQMQIFLLTFSSYKEPTSQCSTVGTATDGDVVLTGMCMCRGAEAGLFLMLLIYALNLSYSKQLQIDLRGVSETSLMIWASSDFSSYFYSTHNGFFMFVGSVEC